MHHNNNVKDNILTNSCNFAKKLQHEYYPYIFIIGVALAKLKHIISGIFSKQRYGYGVHSPFSYHLIKNVIQEKNPYYCYEKLENLREKLSNDKEEIQFFDIQTQTFAAKQIRNLLRDSVSAHYGQLLFRLANHAKPQTIIHFGASLGLTTGYLASVGSTIPCTAVETCPNTAIAAKKTIEACDFSNVSIYTANNEDEIQKIIQNFPVVDFVFVDKNFKNKIKNIFYTLLPKITDKSIFVFADINRNNETRNTWEEITKNEKVHISIDLINMGIVYFSPEFQKQHYKFYF